MSNKETQLINQMPLGKLMGTITKNYYGALSKRIEPLGLDRHFTTLIVIDSIKDKCTQQCLCDFLNYDKVTMMRIINYLVKKKMIKRAINKNDRREYIIQLTDKANLILPKIKEEIKYMNAKAFKGFTKNEIELYKGFTSVVIKNLENLPVNKVDIKIKK